MDDSGRVALAPFAILSAAALGLEVLLTRFLAYSVAAMLIYTVLGIALVGFGAGGTLVTLTSARLESMERGAALAWACLAFCLATLIGFAAFVRLTPFVSAFNGVTLAIASLLILPFLAAGFVVALALAKAASTGVCYAANLAGSAIGCFLPLIFLRSIGGERMIVLLAALGWVAAWLFARSAGEIERALKGALLGTAGAIAVSGAFATRLYSPKAEPLPFGQVSVVRDYAARFGIRESLLYDKWNATGRVQVFGYEVPGAPKPYPFLFYAQDSSAGSCLTRWEQSDSGEPSPAGAARSDGERACRQTVWGQAYFKPRAKVLVIGLGGGMDVQCALYNDAESVDVVEINPDSIAAVRGPFNDWLGKIGSNPRVTYHLGDGRSFVHRADHAGYDVIQLSGVDTKNSASSGGLALSENTLYTEEAFEDYLANLNEGGVLSLVRFGDGEAVRLSATAAQALRAAGVSHPEQHVAVLGSTYVRGVLVTRSPWSNGDTAALERQFEPIAGQPYGVSIFFYRAMSMDFTTPPAVIYAPPGPGGGVVGSYFASLAEGRDRQALANASFDATPTSDDRPFFFDGFRYRTWAALSYPHVAALAGVLGSVLVLAVLLLILPLVFSGRSKGAAGSAARRTLGASLDLCVYFSSIGLAYLLVEVWLIHRFAMYLGHQTYSLGVVLSALLIGSGAGSALGDRALPVPRRRLYVAVFAIFVFSLSGATLLPALLDASAKFGVGGRALLAIAYVAPLGVFMGLPFPAGLAVAQGRSQSAVPWYVGVNGFASVVATLAVIPLSHALGYRAVLFFGAGLYALAAIAFSLGLGATRTR